MTHLPHLCKIGLITRAITISNKPNQLTKHVSSTSIDHFVHLKQGKIFVREWIPTINTDKAPILLMHDSLGCVELWRNFPALLSERSGRKVIAYDRFGYGRSDKRLDSLSMNFISEESEVFLPTILDQLHLKNFVIFGHSVGGPMSVICASKFGDACVGLITESAQSFVEDRTLKGITDAKKNFQNLEQIERLKKYHSDKAKWVLDAWTETWLDPRFASWSLENDLPLIKCPLLVIHGDKDEFGSIKHPKMICDFTGGLSKMHILQDCGHVPHREKTEEVLNLVANFLQ